MLRYLLLSITLVIPLWFIYYTYRYLDHKKMEPKRAVFFSLFFSFLIFFIEFFLVKPSIGKIFSFFDTYFFVYFISEETEHLKTLSITQNCLVVFLAAFSKAITYSIGLKTLFKWLERLGQIKFIAGKHINRFGFLDEPIDYTVYSLIYFSGFALFDNLIHFRFNSLLSTDKIQAFILLFVYLCLGITVSLIWLSLKFKKNNSSTFQKLLWPFPLLNLSTERSFWWGFLSNTEFYSFILLLLIFILLKITFLISTILTLMILLFLFVLLTIGLFTKVKGLNNFIINPPN